MTGIKRKKEKKNQFLTRILTMVLQKPRLFSLNKAKLISSLFQVKSFRFQMLRFQLFPLFNRLSGSVNFFVPRCRIHNCLKKQNCKIWICLKKINFHVAMQSYYSINFLRRRRKFESQILGLISFLSQHD